jgi:hypothetical protein
MLRHYKDEALPDLPLKHLVGNSDHETVHGVSRFAVSPKRLGAVSAAAFARPTILPLAHKYAARRAPRAIRARLSRPLDQTSSVICATHELISYEYKK